MEQTLPFTIRPSLLRFFALTNGPVLGIMLLLAIWYPIKTFLTNYEIWLVLTTILYLTSSATLTERYLTGPLKTRRGFRGITLPLEQIDLHKMRRLNKDLSWYAGYQIPSLDGDIIVLDWTYRPADCARMIQLIEAQRHS